MSTSLSSLSPPPTSRDEDQEMDDAEELNEWEYEQERAENMKNNAALLESLGLKGVMPKASSNDKKPNLSSEEQRARREARTRAAALKRKIEPVRRSGRVAAIQQRTDDVKSENEEETNLRPSQILFSIPKQKPLKVPSGPEYESAGLESQPRPQRAKDGTLIFEGGYKETFKPNLTPEEMFRGGAFGGAFFCDTFSKITKTQLSSSRDISELPFKLPSHLIPTHLSRPVPEGSVNRFGVRAGQSLQEWEKAGWIWEEDPRGWAQWYTRFWAGRRTADDTRQVARWQKVAGPTGRFKNALIKRIAGAGGLKVLGEEDIGRVVRQCLWQWGYELTENEWAKVFKT